MKESWKAVTLPGLVEVSGFPMELLSTVQYMRKNDVKVKFNHLG